MAKYDQTGIPSIVTAKSAAGAQTLFADVVTPQPLGESLASLARAALDKFPDAAGIVIDPVARKVTAASGAQGAALIAAMVGATSDRAIITADAGQTGRSLTWTSDGTESEFAPNAKAVVPLAVGAQKPKRTVEGLVTALLTGVDYGAETVPMVAINQATGEVHFGVEYSAGSLLTAINAVPVAGDQIQLALTEPETTGTESALPFEGGAV